MSLLHCANALRRILCQKRKFLHTSAAVMTADSGVPYGTSIQHKDSKDALTSTLPSHADVVVIGAGAVGCSTAYHLSKLIGGNVVVLEKNRITSGTTWHTAGILWSFRPSEAETLMQLQTRDLISDELPSVTGEDAGWIKTGTLNIAKNKGDLKDITQFSTLAKAMGVEIFELPTNQIKDIHPLLNLDDVYGAVYSPGDGTIDPATYCMSYVKGAMKLGAKVIENCSVTNISTRTDDFGNVNVSSVDTTMGSIKTEKVVCCAGAWSPYIAEMVGVQLPQLTYKHAYVVTEPIPGILNTPMVKDHRTVYIKPQGEALQFGGYEANPHRVEDLPRDFAFGLYDLDWDVFEPHNIAAINRVPAIGDSGIRSTVCGPESFTPDGKPNMGESPEVRGFFVGCAFNSGGIMGSGGAGRQLAHWVYHGRPEIDLFICDIRRHQRKFTNYNKWLVEKTHEKFTKRFSLVFPYDHSLGGRNQRKTKMHEAHMSQGALMGCRNGFERPAYYVKENGVPNTRLNVLEYMYYGSYGFKEHTNDKYCDEVMNDCTHEFPVKSHRLIGRECLTCRTSAALFDSSYMAKLYLRGKDADKAVRRLLTRDLTRSRDNHFIYSLMLTPSAGIECDVIATKVKGESGDIEYYITAPSSGEQYCQSHMQRFIQDEGLNCLVDNRTEERSILSVQGPKSARWLESVLGKDVLFGLKYGQWTNVSLAGADLMVGRLSFVGELGYELHCNSNDVVNVCNTLMSKANDFGACMAGYRAMDSLSSEIGFHHWPHTINLSDNPVEANMLRFCDKTSHYIGADQLSKLRHEPLKKRIVYVTVDCDGPIYGNEVIRRNDAVVGHLRSGSYAHVLDTNIGCGYVTLGKSLPNLDDDAITQGDYVIERMGVKHKARVHLVTPFDPKLTRMAGKYSESDQEKLQQRLNLL